MNKKILLVLLVVLVVFASGCTETGRTTARDYYDDPDNFEYIDPNSGNEEYYDSQRGEACGYEGEACCQYFGRDAFGMLTGYDYCNDYLECRAGLCVEGPEYESNRRPGA
ncbi:hypothetical protein ACFLQN_00335 [Candidatus Aenigmatarchaeota archaeon]